MRRYLLFTFLLFGLIPCKSFAQLSGIYTINSTLPTAGTNFSSFTDAINAVNLAGVNPATGVTFRVSSGQIFYDRPPVLHASGYPMAPITFIKYGTLANPVVMPSTAGTVSLGSTISSLGGNGDGVIRMSGCDYVIFDGIDIGLNSGFGSTTEYYEYGYVLFRGNSADACQNVTIMNATINMQPLVPNSAGIYTSDLDSNGVTVTAAATSGRVENLVIRKNTIVSAYIGIELKGFTNSATPYTLIDHFATVDSNDIQSFGGGGVECYGIYLINQDSALIAYNTIQSSTTAANTYGIRPAATNGASLFIKGNTISLACTAGGIYGIDNSAGANGGGNVIDISDNIVTNCSASAGSLYPIRGAASPSYMNIYNNEISNITNTGSGTLYGIYSIPSGTTTVSKVYKNHLYNLTHTSTSNSSTLYTYICNSSAETHFYQNNIHDITHYGNNATIIGRTNSTNFYYYNNVVYRLYTPNSTNADAIRAVEINNGNASHKVLFNTVYLDATSASTTTYGNSCLYVNPTTNLNVEVRNNIFVNASVPGPTGGYVCNYRRGSAVLTNYNIASDNNCFYTDTLQTRRVVFADGTNFINLPDFKNLIGPNREASSFFELPPFVNTTTMPYDLTLSNNLTLCSDNASAVTIPFSITTDILDNLRGIPADIGAYEIGTVLPINYLQLKADYAGFNAVLQWKVITADPKRFFIERSLNGENFVAVASIQSTGSLLYDFVDEDALKGASTLHYRIRQVNQNNESLYSNIVKISRKEDRNPFILSAAPNPFKGVPSVSLVSATDGVAFLEVLDITGKKLVARKINIQQGLNHLAIDEFSNYALGFYTIQVKMNDKNTSLKLIKDN
jgi:hypothetical protein